MCSYKLLAHNENGYIIKCNQCQHYQTAFGTIIFSVEKNQFVEFINEIKKVKDETICNGFPLQKRIHIKLLDNSVLIILNFKELHQLHSLLEEVLVIEEINNFLFTNNIKPLF